jgi:hypothetical protein
MHRSKQFLLRCGVKLVVFVTIPNHSHIPSLCIEGPFDLEVVMSSYRECLERAAYCAHLAIGEKDIAMRAFLERLAMQWAVAAKETPPKASDPPPAPTKPPPIS